jgi:hypothetical protein
MSEQKTLTGGCLCGALRYEMTKPPILAYTCHCTVCQKLTSSAFSSALLALLWQFSRFRRRCLRFAFPI